MYQVITALLFSSITVVGKMLMHSLKDGLRTPLYYFKIEGILFLLAFATLFVIDCLM